MNLQLSLKKKWFEMTKAGIKTEDYREITPYWIQRLTIYQDGIEKWEKESLESIANDFSFFLDAEDIDYEIDNWYMNFKSFNQNTMTLGYPKKGDFDRTIQLEHKGIEIRTGNPDWGAEPNKLYFVIKHGNIIHSPKCDSGHY